MNKVYRTVSEVTKAHGKSGVSGNVVSTVLDSVLFDRKMLAVSIAVAAALASQSAMADNARIENGSAQSTITISPSDSTTGNGGAKATGRTSIAAGWNAKADGENSMAAGVKAQAVQRNSIAIGNEAKVENSPANPSSSSIAIGDKAKAQGDLALAIGPGATVSGESAAGGIAIGSAATSNNGGMAVGSGANAGNGTPMIPGLPVRLNNNVALGDSALVKDDTNFRVALGSFSIAGESDLTAAPYKPTVNANVAGIAGPGVELGEVSVGGDNTAGMGKILYRRVTNVAAGAADTDAVNVSQLRAINNSVGNVSGAVENLRNRMGKLQNDSEAGTASALAAAGLPQAYLPGKSMIAVSGSTYRGQQGYAVGMSAISDSGNWIVKGTAAGNSRGHFGATIGAGYQW